MSEENETENEDIKRLREKAKAADSLKKELAFAKAGIDYESGQGALLFKIYDGELTADKIMATATEYGIKLGSEPEEVAPIEEASNSEEQETLEQIQSASQVNDSSSNGLGPDPWGQAFDALEQSRKAGEPIEWQHAAAISKIVAADNRNDPRVKGKPVGEDVTVS